MRAVSVIPHRACIDRVGIEGSRSGSSTQQVPPLGLGLAGGHGHHLSYDWESLRNQCGCRIVDAWAASRSDDVGVQLEGGLRCSGICLGWRPPIRVPEGRVRHGDSHYVLPIMSWSTDMVSR